MSVNITIEISRTFETSASYDRVFDLLADVPASVSHFPKVEQLVDLGDNAYRWEMKKIGVDKHAIQTIYACQYSADKERGSITWAPIKGEGNSEVQGSWTVVDKGGRVEVRFQTKGSLTLPLPSLLKLAISPVVKHEFNSLVDVYIDNLQKEFAS
ncbi:SRPBCC family protein [Hahella aquimaris]|uniref:SRPBCC family protein n=1 Tax=Hahella sp. HNIBRBA332 TaxID=3015983 RepID=UPI00273A80C2|nr:SRPBCC family protein [Hahella sp. HNIBRBA332]WLQ11901.1 SRPBCC family protein [Hahella sp. HNIBRBA332]